MYFNKVAALLGTCSSSCAAVLSIQRSHRHHHFFLAYLSADRTRKTIVITILIKSVLSATFSPHISNLFFPSFSPSNSNHHSPPSFAGSNSLSSFVCKGPLLSSLRRALIRSATLNKEGKTERERERGRERESDMERQCSSGDVRVSINPERGAARAHD